MRVLVTVCGLLLFLAAPPPPRPQTPDRVPPLPGAPRDENELPDLSGYSPVQRIVYLSARRGAEWLWQANRPDGLFVPGLHTAVQLVIDDDDCVHQAGATMALARAARFMQNERFAVRARQAALTLLASTLPEVEDKSARVLVNVNTPAQRLAASALLVLAIHELPAPGDDLLEQAEQLCRFLRNRQKADGFFGLDKDEDAAARAMAPLAFYAVARTQHLRPADWKAQFVAKGVAYLRQNWKEQDGGQQTPYLVLAAGEQACSTRDQVLADFTYQLCDHLCQQQCRLDPRQPLWEGGFKELGATGAPSVTGALNVAALAVGCRVAREFKQGRFEAQYRDAIERHLHFLTTLQFLPTNTKHFADNYRLTLLGAFHATQQDGTVRIEYNQLALQGMIDYLEIVAPVPKR